MARKDKDKRKSVREPKEGSSSRERSAQAQRKSRNKAKRKRRTTQQMVQGDRIRDAFVQMVCQPGPKARNIPAIILWCMWQHFVIACGKLNSNYDPEPEKKTKEDEDEKPFKIWTRLKWAFPEWPGLLRNRSPEVTKKREDEFDEYTDKLTDQYASTLPGFKQDVNVVLTDPREWTLTETPGYGYSVLFNMLFSEQPEVFEQFKVECIDLYELFVKTAPSYSTKYYRQKQMERQAALLTTNGGPSSPSAGAASSSVASATSSTTGTSSVTTSKVSQNMWHAE
jgi:hypothetical protein